MTEEKVLEESQNMHRFRLIPTTTNNALRSGELMIKGQNIPTPQFIVPTSRGAVPHITPDVLAKHTSIKAVHFGLEDFIERTVENAPILSGTSLSRLRDFTAFPDNVIQILGPRRVPAIPCPGHNTNSAIITCTSVGFQPLPVEDYSQAATKLNADITISIADVVKTDSISQKRLERSADRTHAWLRDVLEEPSPERSPLYVSIPPLETHQQSFYLADLSEEYRQQISGLAMYSADTAASLPERLTDLPRMCLEEATTPQDVLRYVSLGNDMLAVPMVTDTSEKGLAFDFSLKPIVEGQGVPMAIDLWKAEHAVDVSPLVKGCGCYTCQKHHRAFINHLLNAKEMLAWTLIQIHNFHVMSTFFADIRTSIEYGTFVEESKAFRSTYALELPQAAGEGPRIRGYQTKSVGGGEPRRNKKAYGRLDDQLMKLQEAESGIATPVEGTSAVDLESQGLGQIQ